MIIIEFIRADYSTGKVAVATSDDAFDVMYALDFSGNIAYTWVDDDFVWCRAIKKLRDKKYWYGGREVKSD